MRVRGYASVFRNSDSDGEVVAPGAFSAWLAKNPEKDLPIFWNHAHQYDLDAMPIGITTTLKQDRKGLYFEGVLNETTAATEVKAVLAKSGKMEASFAFWVDQDEIKNSVRHFTAVTPFEITAANWGANSKAYLEVIPEDTGENNES